MRPSSSSMLTPGKASIMATARWGRVALSMRWDRERPCSARCWRHLAARSRCASTGAREANPSLLASLRGGRRCNCLEPVPWKGDSGLDIW
jgi:hypothetical protein